MRKKELEHSFEELRANMELNFTLLAKRIEQLEKENKELDELVDSTNETLSHTLHNLQRAFVFVNRYGKDGIHYDFSVCGYGELKLNIEYFAVNRVFHCSIPVNQSIGTKLNVIENDENFAVLEVVTALFGYHGGYKEYYKLDKFKQTCTEIPKPACVLEKELAEQEQSAKKTSSEKKESKKK